MNKLGSDILSLAIGLSRVVLPTLTGSGGYFTSFTACPFKVGVPINESGTCKSDVLLLRHGHPPKEKGKLLYPLLSKLDRGHSDTLYWAVGVLLQVCSHHICLLCAIVRCPRWCLYLRTQTCTSI